MYQSVAADRPTIIVSASGGPIPQQNYKGELFSWGLERPSGTLVRFSGASAQISLVEAKNPQARPRFAVAWDYADIIGKEKHGCGVFRTFESDASGMNFTIHLNQDLKLPDMDLIDRIDLFHYTSVPPKKLPLTVRYLGQHRYKAFSDDSISERDKKIFFYSLRNSKKPLFFSLRFKPTFEIYPAFQQYDFTSAWNIRVEVVDKATVIQEEYQERARHQLEIARSMLGASKPHLEMAERMKAARGVVIRRHSRHGEVPDHMELSEMYGEYVFDWGKYGQ